MPATGIPVYCTVTGPYTGISARSCKPISVRLFAMVVTDRAATGNGSIWICLYR